MALEQVTGTLTITANRGGTVDEICRFLEDLENSYLHLYRFEHLLETHRRQERWSRIFGPTIESFAYHLLSMGTETPSPEWVLPKDRLIVTGIRIESPGIWEFLASLNPLQQIREYLNDRHKRRQDKEFRETAERERLGLDNELVQIR